jgi:hypothetical protein
MSTTADNGPRKGGVHRLGVNVHRSSTRAVADFRRKRLYPSTGPIGEG